MSQPSRGLGKGLSAILSGAPTADELRGAARPASVSSVEIPVGQIEANPYQPRQSFDAGQLEGLASSIRSLGIITPITLRKISPLKYQIISGERRFRAAQMAGLKTVPAYIREADDQGMLEMAIVENIQRADLDPIEVAQSYKRLMDECGLTQESMSERLGKSRSSIANCLRLLNLPAKVQHDLKLGQISVGHAKVLLGLDDPALQVKYCDMVIAEGLNVRDLEKKIKPAKSPGAPANQTAAVPAPVVPELHRELCLEMAKYFKGKITMKRTPNGKGSLTVNFASDKEISNFLDALKK